MNPAINRMFLRGMAIGVILTVLLGSGLIISDVLALSEDEIPPHTHDSIACLDDTSTGSSSSHSHSMKMLTEEDVIPMVSIEANEDPVSGFNVQISVTDFSFAPQNAGVENVDGEGHAHLYVDGVKIGRVYGEWVYVGNLEAGLHEIKVSLNSNMHETLMFDGQEIADSVVVVVE